MRRTRTGERPITRSWRRSLRGSGGGPPCARSFTVTRVYTSIPHKRSSSGPERKDLTRGCFQGFRPRTACSPTWGSIRASPGARASMPRTSFYTPGTSTRPPHLSCGRSARWERSGRGWHGRRGCESWPIGWPPVTGRITQSSCTKHRRTRSATRSCRRSSSPTSMRPTSLRWPRCTSLHWAGPSQILGCWVYSGCPTRWAFPPAQEPRSPGMFRTFPHPSGPDATSRPLEAEPVEGRSQKPDGLERGQPPGDRDLRGRALPHHVDDHIGDSFGPHDQAASALVDDVTVREAFGRHQAGVDRRYQDPLRLQLVVQSLGEGHHGVLRRGVHRCPRHRVPPGQRGDVDDVSPAGLEHHREERLCAVQDSQEVDLGDPLDLLYLEVSERPAPRDAGVVYQEVAPAEGVAHSSRQRLHLAELGHIATRGERPAAFPVDL